VTGTFAASFALLPLALAFALAPLIKGRLQTALVLLDLWLLAEVAAALIDPGYPFGTLLLERLVASGLQLGLAYGALLGWRRWRAVTASVTAH
jgi:hypothetical protein